jgi:hypothetical protein
MGGDIIAGAIWYIAMPVEEPSTASEAEVYRDVHLKGQVPRFVPYTHEALLLLYDKTVATAGEFPLTIVADLSLSPQHRSGRKNKCLGH